jgi:hypothetical protein
MIRVVIENILLFLLPTLLYVGWVLLTRQPQTNGPDGEDAAERKILDDAPLLWLFTAGAALVVVTLVAFESSSSGGKPGQHYVPPSYKDGKIEPGHIE